MHVLIKKKKMPKVSITEVHIDKIKPRKVKEEVREIKRHVWVLSDYLIFLQTIIEFYSRSNQEISGHFIMRAYAENPSTPFDIMNKGILNKISEIKRDALIFLFPDQKTDGNGLR